MKSKLFYSIVFALLSSFLIAQTNPKYAEYEKEILGTWVFTQTQSCYIGDFLFAGTNATGICEKIKVTFTKIEGVANGYKYSSLHYKAYHLRLPIKDGIIIDDKEIGDGAGAIMYEGLFSFSPTYDKKHTKIDCSGNHINAMFDDCFIWDAQKKSPYSNFVMKIGGRDCHIAGYWEREGSTPVSNSAKEVKKDNSKTITVKYLQAFWGAEEASPNVIFQNADGTGQWLYFSLKESMFNDATFLAKADGEEKTNKQNVGKKYKIIYTPNDNVVDRLGEIQSFELVK